MYLSHVLENLEAQIRGLDRDGLHDQLHVADHLLRIRQLLEQQKSWSHTMEARYSTWSQ